MHTVGLIQFMGFYVPLVHCGIMQSDLLHVKSYAFEGFRDFVFGECYAGHVLSPKKKTWFISCHSSGMTWNTLIHQKLIQDSSHDSESVLDLLKLIYVLAAPALFPSTIMHLRYIYFYGCEITV